MLPVFPKAHGSGFPGQIRVMSAFDRCDGGDENKRADDGEQPACAASLPNRTNCQPSEDTTESDASAYVLPTILYYKAYRPAVNGG